MEPHEIVIQALSEHGIQIDEERARLAGSSDGLYPLMIQLIAGLREVDAEGYEPIDKPYFW